MTNPRADRVREVQALSRRSVRSRSGRFLVEGPQAVRELLRYAAPTAREVYATQDAGLRYADILAAADAAGVPVYPVSVPVLAALGDTETPQGLLAVAQQPVTDLAGVLAEDGRSGGAEPGPRLLVLLDEIRDPGNLGTVIRAADAAGADAVLVSKNSVDAFSPKVVRSTAGSLFHLPVVTGLDAQACVRELAAHGIRTYATEGEARTTVQDLDLLGRHCWVFGTEAHGLPDALAAQCSARVSVPIFGQAESLNVAMAATICLYASAVAHRG
ncbi:MAG: RNA methyltransferase [Nostocoides sp.]